MGKLTKAELLAGGFSSAADDWIVNVFPPQLEASGLNRIKTIAEAIVATMPPLKMSAPYVGGIPQVGSVLTATSGVYTIQPSAVNIQWYRNGVAVQNAITHQYLVTGADANAQIIYEETPANKNGLGRPNRSDPVTIVNALTDLNLSLTVVRVGTSVSIDIGNAAAGSTLSATLPAGLTLNSGTRKISGTPTTQSSDPIVITESLSGVANSPRNTTIQFSVLAALGTTVTVPVNDSAPVITGSGAVGTTLLVNVGVWQGAPTGYEYQWRANNVNIVGATSNIYIPTSDDVDKIITCRVVAKNLQGSSTPTLSNSVTCAFVIPTLTPGSEWTISNNAGVAGIPSPRSDQVYDATQYPVPSCRRTRGFFLNAYEYSTISAEKIITIQATETKEAIPVSCEGNTVMAPFGQNPVDGTWGHLVRIKSRPGQNGYALVQAVLTPAYGGMADTISIPLHLNTDATGKGYVPTATRYIRLEGNDLNDGLTAQTAKRTIDAAVSSVPLVGAQNSKNTIWVFDIGPGTRDDFMWKQMGPNPLGTGSTGQPRSFAYQPVFHGAGKATSYITVDDIANGYVWNAAPFGGKTVFARVAKFENLTLDLKETIQKTGGAWFDNCYIRDDWGKLRALTLSYPKNDGFVSGKFPVGFAPNTHMRWMDTPDASGTIFPRWMMSNCNADVGECGGFHQRYNCNINASYDVVAVGLDGRWAHQNNRIKQTGNLELFLHADDFLTVKTVTQSDTNGGYTELTFESGGTWATSTATSVDFGNTFLRVLQATNSAAISGQDLYNQNADGSRDFPYFGYKVQPNSLATFPPGFGWDSAAKKVRIVGKPAISVGDQVSVYNIGKGDAGQFLQDTKPALPQIRENFTFINNTFEAHTWQVLYPQGGYVQTDGITVGGTAKNISGVTVTAQANSATITFDNGIPNWLQQYDYIGYAKTANGVTNTVFRSVISINYTNNTVVVNQPFVDALSATTIQCAKAIVGLRISNSIYNKSGMTEQVGMYLPGLVDTEITYSTIPGTSKTNQTFMIRTPGTDGSGYWDTRISDSILRNLSMPASEIWPGVDGFVLDNCWTEMGDGSNAIPAPNVRRLRGTGAVFGSAAGLNDPTLAYTNNYTPDATMTKTIVDQIKWRQRKVGQRIGAKA